MPITVYFLTWKKQLGHDRPASFLFLFFNIKKSERGTHSSVLDLALYLSLGATLLYANEITKLIDEKSLFMISCSGFFLDIFQDCLKMMHVVNIWSIFLHANLVLYNSLCGGDSSRGDTTRTTRARRLTHQQTLQRSRVPRRNHQMETWKQSRPEDLLVQIIRMLFKTRWRIHL